MLIPQLHISKVTWQLQGTFNTSLHAKYINTQYL